MTRPISHLFVHCSATPPGWDKGAAGIREIHLKRGSKDNGYHYVIRRNGWIELGRPESQVGAHAAGWNENSLGVCLIGGVDENGHGNGDYTRWQLIALRALYVVLSVRYPGLEIIGHRDTGAKKDCPCFDVKHWLLHDELIQPRNIKGA